MHGTWLTEIACGLATLLMLDFFHTVDLMSVNSERAHAFHGRRRELCDRWSLERMAGCSRTGCLEIISHFTGKYEMSTPFEGPLLHSGT
jgi:hypothetical protein